MVVVLNQPTNYGYWITLSYLWSWESLQFVKELVFLCRKYYSIFLLQQDASALWNTVVINNNGIFIHFS